MSRLIIVSFGILGLIFYELSGGADYAPREASLQVQGFGPNTHLTASGGDAVARGDSAPADLFANRVEATLASLPVARVDTTTDTQEEKIRAIVAPDQTDDPAKSSEDAAVAAALGLDETQTREVWPGAIELFARQQQETDLRIALRAEAEAAARAAIELRVVSGDVANMRSGPGTGFDKVTSLRGGSEVLVLSEPGNGWVELEVIETGQIGWMADWLVETKN
ncbi:MAG: SH3 domain-containing protein [Pseudomonadota bacterium]